MEHFYSLWVYTLGFIPIERLRFQLQLREQMGTIHFYCALHIQQQQTSKETVAVTTAQSEWTLNTRHFLYSFIISMLVPFYNAWNTVQTTLL